VSRTIRSTTGAEGRVSLLAVLDAGRPVVGAFEAHLMKDRHSSALINEADVLS
jgi:hypothetical protein